MSFFTWEARSWCSSNRIRARLPNSAGLLGKVLDEVDGIHCPFGRHAVFFLTITTGTEGLWKKKKLYSRKKARFLASFFLESFSDLSNVKITIISEVYVTTRLVFIRECLQMG